MEEHTVNNQYVEPVIESSNTQDQEINEKPQIPVTDNNTTTTTINNENQTKNVEIDKHQGQDDLVSENLDDKTQKTTNPSDNDIQIEERRDSIIENDNLPENSDQNNLKADVESDQKLNLVNNPYRLCRTIDTLATNLDKKVSVKDNLHFWMTNLTEKIRSLDKVLEDLDNGMRLKNMDVSSRHKVIKSFYENYLVMFNISVENNDKYLYAKFMDLKAKQMDKVCELTHFDKALMNIHEAQSRKKNEIAEYKGKFQKIVLDNYDNDLYKHPIIQDWLETIKNVDKTKSNLNKAVFELNEIINDFMCNFEESQYLENKSRISEKCTHQQSLQLTNALNTYENCIKNYCEQVVSIIPKSKAKERQTMLAIRNSFTHFLEITKDTFGSNSIKDFTSSNLDFEALSNIDATFTTFEINNILTPEYYDQALKILKKNELSDANDLQAYTLSFQNDKMFKNISENFVRMKANINVTEVKVFKDKKNKLSLLCLSFDDITSIYAENRELVYDFHWVNCTYKQTGKNQIELRIAKQGIIFKKKQKLLIDFHDENDFKAFKHYREEAQNCYANISE